MSALNKFIKGAAYVAATVWTWLKLLGFSFVMTSPVFCVVFSVLDCLERSVPVLTGNYLVLWFVTSAVVAAVMIVFVEVSSWRMRHGKKEKKEKKGAKEE